MMQWTVIYHHMDTGLSILELNGPMDAEAAYEKAQDQVNGDVIVMAKGLHKVWEPEKGWLNDPGLPNKTDAQLHDLYEV